MLERLKFTNFKSWVSADVQCGRITGIFGTNSSGKTSILQFPLVLKQTKDATDRAISIELNGDLVKLGTIKDAIHRHEENRGISFGITFSLEEELILKAAIENKTIEVARGKTLTLSADLFIQALAPKAKKIEYELGQYKFDIAQKNGDVNKFELKATNAVRASNNFNFTRTTGRAWQLPGPIKSYAFPDQARTYHQNSGFLAELESSYEKALDKIYYLGPLREPPNRDYLWARSRPTDVGQRGEKAIDAILAASAAQDKRNLGKKKRLMPFQEMIAHWLRELGLIDNFKVEEIVPGSNRWQAKVTTKKGSSEVLLTDVGVGVSQVLPVITLLQYVPEGSTVILEQPEIHLHPLAQASLADVIIHAAVHRKIQVVLESHSEHLLLRLQRRIAEEALPVSDVKLYFCDAPNGESKLEPLELDLLGAINNWPKNFMGDAFGETAKAEIARLKRQQNPR